MKTARESTHDPSAKPMRSINAAFSVSEKNFTIGDSHSPPTLHLI